MRYYIALLHKDPDSDFGVSFPDFPGCVSAGSTLDEAASMAAEALAGHVTVMVEGGLPIPDASSLDDIMADPVNHDGVPVMIAAPPLSRSRAVRVNVTIPEDVLADMDRYAQARGLTRSGFIVQAATSAMDMRATR